MMYRHNAWNDDDDDEDADDNDDDDNDDTWDGGEVTLVLGKSVIHDALRQRPDVARPRVRTT